MQRHEFFLCLHCKLLRHDNQIIFLRVARRFRQNFFIRIPRFPSPRISHNKLQTHAFFLLFCPVSVPKIDIAKYNRLFFSMQSNAGQIVTLPSLNITAPECVSSGYS